MYQPYPTSGAVPPQPTRPAPPRPVVLAARLMYVGAAVSALNLIAGLFTVGAVRSTLHHARPDLSPTQLHQYTVFLVVSSVISAVVSIALWLGMAYATRAGHSWARIASTVLFAINTLLLAVSVARVQTVLDLIVSLLVWVVGLAAVVLLWRKESSAFYAAARGR